MATANFILDSLVTFFSGSTFTGVSASAAALAIYFNIRIAKNRATIDLVLSEMKDEKLQEAIKRVNKLAKDKKIPVSYYISYIDNKVDNDACDIAEEKHCKYRIANVDFLANFEENRAHILKVLNSREFVAVGIHENAFSEKIYKRTNCSNYIRDWSNLSGVVFELRRESGKDTLFQDFERLAKKWKRKPLKHNF